MNGSGVSNAKLRLSPGDIDFGTQKVGSHTTMVETLTSVGDANVIITSVFVGAPFSQTNNCVGNPLPPGSSCTVNITFSPTQSGGFFTIFQTEDNTSDFNAANVTGNAVP
jgi:hypothetical protein